MIQNNLLVGYNMYEDPLMKYRSRFLITTFLYFTREALTLYKRFIMCLIFRGIFAPPYFFYLFAIYSTASISDRLSDVCCYVLSLVVRLFDVVYLAVGARILRV